MIFPNFNSMAKCMMGFLIFDALQNVLNVEALPAGISQEGTAYVHYDVVKAEDETEIGITNACKASLTGIFNGFLAHDALEVKLDENATKTQKDYHELIKYAFAKITTGADLIAYYCNKIDPLIRIGFTGELTHDFDMATKGTNALQKGALVGIKEMHRQKYSNYMMGANILTQHAEMKKVAVRNINMFLEYSKRFKFLNSPVTDEDDQCRGELAYDEYSGEINKDIGIKNKRTDTQGNEKLYGEFLDHLSKMNVSKTDQIISNVYCDIMYTLRINKFTGKKDSDLSVQGEAEIEDVAHGYKYFIQLPENSGCGDDCIEKYAIYRINYK